MNLKVNRNVVPGAFLRGNTCWHFCPSLRVIILSRVTIRQQCVLIIHWKSAVIPRHMYRLTWDLTKEVRLAELKAKVHVCIWMLVLQRHCRLFSSTSQQKLFSLLHFPPTRYVDVCRECESQAPRRLSVCSPCSWVWRSHNWSGVWTYSVSGISRSVRQQPSLHLDYRGWYGQDHQVIR